MSELLALENVTAGYGESIVLEDVSFALQEGDSLALLGRNGVAARSAGAAAISCGCRPTSARMPALAGCRRSVSCFRR
jgi:ABC-type branched-subunit amino acid transport system ATPase component